MIESLLFETVIWNKWIQRPAHKSAEDTFLIYFSFADGSVLNLWPFWLLDNVKVQEGSRNKNEQIQF